MNVSLKALIGKLNAHARNAVEAAAGLCVSRTHYDVEIEHYLTKLLDDDRGDAARIFERFDVDRARLARDLAASLDELKSGNARTPALSPSLVQLLEDGWLFGSVELGATEIRTGFTLVALASSPELRRLAGGISEELTKISAETLRNEFDKIVARSEEETSVSTATAPRAAGKPGAPAGGGKLEQYTYDLTERARQGQLDPVLGRDREIRQVVDILTRRRQNNPILVGEAGVGKTAVVEGFAMRVAEGEVPKPLRNATIRSLDLALLQAGAGVKGEFEKRLKGLIDEVKSSPSPVILFIDEAHTMIGAGGAAGQGDAANLLKPALARGELRTIAATTWSEYKKYIEKDPALTRRFQLIKVEEPTEELCDVMMRAVVPRLERHHNVRILDSGMVAAVRLSARYLSDRHLPDKAVTVLDTACARLALGQSSTPAPIEDAERRIDDLDVQRRILRREMAVGADHSERLALIAEERKRVEAELAELRRRWERERELVARAREIRDRIEELIAEPRENGGAGRVEAGEERVGTGEESSSTEEAPAKAQEEPTTEAPRRASSATEEAHREAEPEETADPDELREELGGILDELETLQGEDPLVPFSVDEEIVSQVISGWTGIPVGKMMRDEVATALSLERHMGERIIGQDHALEIVSHRIRTSHAKIEDPKKPKGVFLFVGPSGVGKTETALALADLLYGGEHNLISINMSEFQEAHTVAVLKGSPPGYVGYGEGGVLTEAVRRRPYSVVLLDEIEKAHPDVLELFFQVFDKGMMDDAEGRRIDFKNTVIILTSNAGTDTIMKLCSDPETMPSWEGLVKALKPELDQIFKPAFLGRTVIVPYFPLRDEALRGIVELKLDRVVRRLGEVHGLELGYDEVVVGEIADRCTEVESGARNIDNILTNTLLPDLSRVLLEAMVEDRMPERIRVTIGEQGEFDYRAADASPAADRAEIVSV